MNTAIEFHDSRIASVETIDDTLVVRFMAACIHRSDGQPGVSAGDCYIQPATLSFSGFSGTAAPFPDGTLAEGMLRLDGKEWRVLPLPFVFNGVVQAEFHFTSGAVLSFSAASASCELFGTPYWVEFFGGGQAGQ